MTEPLQIPPYYWHWIRSEAALVDADGCSGPATGVHIECCFEHDLSYYYAKDPHSAYRLYRGGALDPWPCALPIDRPTVEARFRKCHQNRSKLGRWSPMALFRWVGVRVGGQASWDKHRAREAREAREKEQAVASSETL
jgi:hypothetical protein